MIYRVVFAIALSFFIPAISIAASCTDITRTLALNSKGPDVSVLQEFLRDRAGYTRHLTGNFGPLTRAAVGKWQIKQSIVTSHQSLGYGQVGPKTRAAMSCTPTPSPLSSPSSNSIESLKAADIRHLLRRPMFL